MAISQFHRLLYRKLALTGVVLACCATGAALFWPKICDWTSAHYAASSTTASDRHFSANVPEISSPKIDAKKFVVRLHASSVSKSTKPTVAGEVVRFSDSQTSLSSYDFISLAKSSTPSDPRVVDWLIQWKQNFALEKTANAEDRNALASILKTTPMGGISLFKIGDSFFSASSDIRTAGVFYKAAVFNGHEQLGKLKPSNPVIREYLAAGPKARATLWVLHDQDLDQECAEALYTFNSDLVHYLRPHDPTMENARQHGYVGILEYYMIEGRNKEGVAFAKTVDTAGMNEEQRVSFAWAYGRVLEGSHQYAEAVPEFERVLSDTHFKYHDNVYSYLVWSLVGAKQLAEAQRVLAEGISKRGLDGRMEASSEYVKAGQLAAELNVQWP